MNLLENGLVEKFIFKTENKKRLVIGNIPKDYPVYRIRLDKLFYNDQNDRISTWISRYKIENNIDKIEQIPKTQKLTATDDYTFIDLYFVSNHDENINVFIGIYRVFKGFFANIKLEGQITRVETKNNEIIIKNTSNNIRCSWAVVYYINTKINSWT